MDLNKQKFTAEIGGKKLTLEVSRMAEQANAAILGTYGDTSVLVTATIGKEERSIDYFPLTVDYEERFYAAGKIMGSRFIRREGRPSEEAVLTGRLIDRSLRPLFDHRLRRDVQVVITVLSYDEENDPDFVALTAASAALAISDIPWNGPLSAARVVKLTDGKIVINPDNSLIKEKNSFVFESFVAGTKDRINMIELAGNEAGENDIVEAFGEAHKEIKKLIEFQEEIIKKIGKPKMNCDFKPEDESFNAKVREFLKGKLEEAVYTTEKTDRESNIYSLKKSLADYLAAEGLSANLPDAERLMESETNILIHKNILESDKRPDGRKLDEVRPLYGEVGLFKRLHGSALFMRGNTQSLAVATLAAPGSEQLIETIEFSGKRRFMFHYNFPPYSTGETGRMGGTGRREIGHGALAEKAVRSLIPSQDEFPYTIRVVSEILSSNGSSSMASVCASCMALMNAGVPIKKPAAGIAMGLIMDEENKSNKTYKILTDIQGPEDHHGDMDCKVAGTRDGVTAIQMDVKIEGVDLAMLKEVFLQAKKARLEILDFIKTVISEPAKEISPFAPTIMTLDINPDQIGEVIGPGGKIINGLIASTGVDSIDIEQTGKVYVASRDPEKAKNAISQIKALTREFQIGEMVEGPVIKILEFGAIVDLGGGRDGMVHVSELKDGFVEKVEDVVKMGDVLKVKIIKIEGGKIGLSLKRAK